jgi:hypothetical protein
MTKSKLLPYINKFTGEVMTLPKSAGHKLSEDWARAKTVTNDKGERVFRFKLSAPVQGKDGKTHIGTAIVDLSPSDEPAGLGALDGIKTTE